MTDSSPRRDPSRDSPRDPPREIVGAAVRRFDDAIDASFQTLRGNPAADRVLYIASEAADYSRAWHAIGIVMAIVSPARRKDAVRLAISLGVESAIVNGALKNLLPRDRPPMLERRAFEVRRPKTKSFPSGHASSASLTAVLLSDAVPVLKPLWWGLAGVVSASRVHNRMHHGSDVTAGLIIGTTMGLAVKRLWPLR